MRKSEYASKLLELDIVDEEELKDMSKDEMRSLLEEYDGIDDMLPNEKYEEYIEHEDL